MSTPCGCHPNSDSGVQFGGYAAYTASKDVVLKPWKYQPRALGDDDVEIKITHCGICHSDIHTVTGGWGTGANFPVIPGHEIVGTVTKTGKNVSTMKVGDRVGVGAQSHSCMKIDTCKYCRAGKEQVCPNNIWTYGSNHPDGQVSQGGYADHIRVMAHFAFKIPESISSEVVGPLLCAGATVFNPLRRFKIGPGSRVGVIGIGGLGHLAVQFASKMGARVTAISSSADKAADATKLGADFYLNSSDDDAMTKAARSFDFLLLTANFSIASQMAKYIALVDVNGTLCTVALPEENFQIPPFAMFGAEINFCASVIGSHDDIVNMLAFAAKHNVAPWIEVMPLSKCNEGIQKVRDNKARFRVVLDVSK